MPFYEHVFIARQDLSQAQVDALAETVTNVIGEFKGTVHKKQEALLKTFVEAKVFDKLHDKE